jgi:hypothetical protein
MLRELVQDKAKRWTSEPGGISRLQPEFNMLLVNGRLRFGMN